jgi:hypothetical protein
MWQEKINILLISSVSTLEAAFPWQKHQSSACRFIGSEGKVKTTPTSTSTDQDFTYYN